MGNIYKEFMLLDSTARTDAEILLIVALLLIIMIIVLTIIKKIKDK